MYRYIALSLFFLSSLTLATTSTASIGLPSVTASTEQVQSNLRENSGFIATGDNIKKLETKQLELLSLLRLTTADTEASQKKEVLKKLITDTDDLLMEWSRLSIQKIDISARTDLTESESLDLQHLSQDLDTKQSVIVQKILELSRILDFGPFSVDTSFSDLQKEFPTIKRLADNTLQEYDTEIAEFEKKKNDTTTQKKKELAEVTAEIERLKHIQQDQILQTSRQIAEYVLLFLAIYIAKIFSLRLVKRFGNSFSKSHQEAIFLFHRWIFNIIIIGVFFLVFASQFLSFLPFVAILGTAVGLALRDVIYSFIGWFAVGSNSGYQEGDFIEFEGTQGRVYQISPLLTSIEEYASQGFTGKIISFPNKTIFEKNVKNWSRGSDFSLMTLDFLLTHQSDIDRAKKLLLDVVSAKETALYEQAHREINTFKSTYKYTDTDLEPQVHIVSDPRGIILRVRVLVHVQDKLSEQSRIMEEFSTAVQKESSIAFRTV